MKSIALELQGVYKKFGSTAAVHDLNLQLAPGEIYGLIGPNGSGKTTTVKMIAGLFRPTRGVIRVAGCDIAKDAVGAKSKLGYVPDEPLAPDHLTGREFLEFVGELWGMKRTVRDERIRQLLGHYGIDDAADAPFSSYSRGHRQKFSFLAALLHEPAVLLIDEPMVGLDPQSARTTIELVCAFAKRGGAVLLLTHQLSVAEQLCDRLGLIVGGHLVEEGSVADFGERAGIRGGSLEDYYLALTK